MDKQKNKRQKLFISILMVLSIVLLSGFVIFWLVGQYKIEKNRLTKDLNDKYIKTHDQVLDSFLISTYITPILKDSVKHRKSFPSIKDEFIKTDSNFHFQSSGRFYALTVDDSLHDVDILKERKYLSEEDHLENNHSVSGRFFSIIVNEDSISDEPKNDTDLKFKDNNEEVLLRSIKLIVHSSNSFSSEDSINQFRFSENLDVDLFIQLFNEHLEEAGFNFELQWLTEEADNDLIKKPLGIILNGNSYYNLPAVIVDHFNFHIFSVIIGQILFALFLIGFSAFAFIFVYRSLKKQIVLNTLRNDFVSNISHELKTPISTINVALEAIKKYNSENNTDKIDEYTDMMSEEMKRFNLLISNVLDHSVLEDNKDILNIKETQISRLIRALIEKINLQYPEVKITIIENSSDVSLKIDSLYISGVLFNLIDNSIKYFSSEVSKSPNIDILTEEDDRNLYITVKDNGPGISKEYFPKLFDKFFRIPTGDKHNVKGYGLGLSFAKLVTEMHGGSISVKNNPEGGCSFIMSIPKN